MGIENIGTYHPQVNFGNDLEADPGHTGTVSGESSADPEISKPVTDIPDPLPERPLVDPRHPDDILEQPIIPERPTPEPPTPPRRPVILGHAGSVPGQPSVVQESVSKQAVEDVLPILNAAGNLNVTEMRGTDKIQGKTGDDVEGSGEVPTLDEADRELLERLVVDLEALVAKLTAEQTKAQIQSSKDRIESLQGTLKQQHENSMAKIGETLDNLKEQYKAKLLQDILGWLGVIVTVVMAVVSVLTCGGAAAAFAVIGAVIAVGLQVCNETGATEELIKLIADSLVESGMSKQEAEAAAQLIFAFISLALSLVSVVGGAASAAKAAKDVAAGVAKAAKTLIKVSTQIQKGIQVGMAVAGGVMSALSLAAGTASMIINYKASEAQAAVTELQAILKKLQTMLEEEEGDLKELLKQLSDCMSAVIELLVSRQDTLNVASMNISA